MKVFTQGLFTGVFAIAMIGCELPQGSELSEMAMDSRQKSAICDPFAQATVTNGLSNEHGWVGSLAYLKKRDRQGNIKLSRFLHKGIRVDAPVYMREVNVPTQAFNQGFKTGDETSIKDLEGNLLTEYFGLGLESEIRLTAYDQAGYYQFAILSDDGSILGIDPDGKGFKKFISNDGRHETKLACAKKAYLMDHSTRLPVRLGYYQGARDQIALMVLWKRVGDSNHFGGGSSDEIDEIVEKKTHARPYVHWGRGQGCGGGVLRDPACGLEGHSVFFDSGVNPPSPQPAFLGLLERGWRVVGAENTYLPASAGTNPCIVQPTPSPSPSPDVTPSPSPSPDVTPSPSPSPDVTPSPSPSPDVTPSPSPSPDVTPSPSPTPTCVGPGCDGGELGV